MILYQSPGACSLADHIALNEANLAFETVKVDLKAKTTDDGQAYGEINPKGYVPALSLDDGELLTENIAILSWIADQSPDLAPKGEMARYRLLETLAFISTEVHKAFKPFFNPAASEEDRKAAQAAIGKRLSLLAERIDMTGAYLFGEDVTVADAYLFVMLRWAKDKSLPIPPPLDAFFELMGARPAVKQTLRAEGLH